MPFKGWFRGSGGDKEVPESELSLEDLIVLERYEEAVERLKTRVKTFPDDLHAHLKLAEVYAELGKVGDAVAQYTFVADEYAQDGFYDKGIALLGRAQKVAPGDATLAHKIYAYQQVKGLDHKRSAAVEGLRQGGDPGTRGTRVLALQRMWHNLAASAVVQQLPTDQLSRLFAALDLIEAPAGLKLAGEGQERPELLWILAGVVESAIALGGSEISVRTFGGGDVLGERALFERRPWPATFRAVEPTLLLKLDRAGLEKTLIGNPDPRRLVDVLRDQRLDGQVEAAVARLRAS